MKSSREDFREAWSDFVGFFLFLHRGGLVAQLLPLRLYGSQQRPPLGHGGHRGVFVNLLCIFRPL